jgi:hypothetical protein
MAFLNNFYKEVIAKTVLKAAMPIASNLASQQVKNLTGSDALANVSKNLMNEGSKELVGSGFNFNVEQKCII